MSCVCPCVGWMGGWVGEWLYRGEQKLLIFTFLYQEKKRHFLPKAVIFGIVSLMVSHGPA